MKKENPAISLESLGFLIRHPWCFVYPFVIIICITISYITGLPHTYECESIVSFGTATIEAEPQKFIQRKNALIAKIYFGDNMKTIIKSVWPGLSEEANPLRYTILMKTLRNPDAGITIKFDRLDQSLAHISFRSRRPAISYAVVQATINTIKLENARDLEEAIESSIIFLTRQLNFYKDKIATIDAEMLRVSSKLREMAVGLNVEQRELVHRITAEATMDQGYNAQAVAGEAKNIDILAELNMKLIEARRNKKMIEMRLEMKDFMPALSESRDKKEDIFQKAIEEKKMVMFDLQSRGALPEHPDVKRLEKAVKDLEALREKELSSGEERTLSEGEKKFAERKLKQDLTALNFAIETLEQQRVILEKYKKTAEGEPVAEEALVGPVAAEATKLKGLRDEKDIMARYYGNLRKQLEDTDLKSRAEKARTGFMVDVVEPPKVPVRPLSSQKFSRLLVGLVMAISAGSAISYLVDSMDKSIRSAADLRNKFQIPVIASIDRIYTLADIKSRRIQRSIIIISMGGFALLGILAVRVVMAILSVI
jgi:hypothetical protein